MIFKKLRLIVAIFCLLFLLNIKAVSASDVLHRVGVKSGSSKDVLYDTVTGQQIQFRGNNFFRYALITQSNGTQRSQIVTFRPGYYNHDEYLAQLTEMKKWGYNAIRVTALPGNILNSTGQIDPASIANITDFLNMAKQNNIYVFMVIGMMPSVYWPSDAPGIGTLVYGQYFNELSFRLSVIPAKKRYLQDFVSALKNNNAPLETIAVWMTENEPTFDKTKWPYTQTSGTFTAPNGITYDMSDASSREQIGDDGLVFDANQERAAIRAIDPDALVTFTMYSPNGLIGNQTYSTYTNGMFNKSDVDLVTVNLYPKHQDVDLEISDMGIGTSRKAILLTEFGGWEKYFSTIEEAATALKDLQVKVCSQYGWSGWFAYDWDTKDSEDGIQMYRVMESGGVINQALAPYFRANACSLTASPSMGNIDTVTSNRLVKGWAFDQEALNNAKINFYIDSPLAKADGSNFAGSLYTTLINSKIYLQYPFMLHPGFFFNIPIKFFADGMSHAVFAVMEDLANGGTATAFNLNGSGKTVPYVYPQPIYSATCNTTVTVPSCVDPGSDFSLAATGIPANKKTNFATWNESTGLGNLVGYPGYLQSDGSWRALIDSSAHPGTGNLRTNIRMIDLTTGNDNLCAALTIPLCSNSTPIPIAGDINNDGVVNILDFTVLSNAFGLTNSAADLNHDGTVNILDFTILSNNFGT